MMKARRFMKCSRVFIVALFICAGALLAASGVSGRPFRTGNIPKNLGCGTCHLAPRGGGERNAFGRDYAKLAIPAGDTYTEELGALDSDGDGFTNDQEFAAGTHPGYADSKP